MFSYAQAYLALPSPWLRAAALAPRSAQCSSPRSPPADAEGELLAPTAEGDWPWVWDAKHPLVSTARPPSLHRAPVCAVPWLQQWVRARLCPHAAQLRAGDTSAHSDPLPPTWGTLGSYVTCAPINSIEKKSRIPSHPLLFVCVLPHCLKSLFGVQFGETPCYTFSALKKAGTSLTESWSFSVSGSSWCVFQSSAHPPLIDLKARYWNQELEKEHISMSDTSLNALSFYKHRIQSKLHQRKPVKTIHLRIEYLISLKTRTAISQL